MDLGVRVKHKRLDFSLFAFNLQGTAVFFIISFLVATPIFSYSNPVPSTPKLDYYIHVDKAIYSVGDTVTIDGYLQLDYFYSDVNIQISIFDWDDGSIIMLVNLTKDFKAMMPIYIPDITRVKALEWTGNKSGEYGIYISVETQNSHNAFSISFIEERFLVVEDGLFINLYTNQLTYLNPQIINISFKILSNNHFEDVHIELILMKNSEAVQKIYDETLDISIQNGVTIISNLYSEKLDGIYELYLVLNFMENEDIRIIKRYTEIFVINNSKLRNVADAYFEEYDWLQQYPDFVYALSKSRIMLSNTSAYDHIFDQIINGYEKLSKLEREALFLSHSIENSYVTTGDLLFWLFTDFVKVTDLEISDSNILFSYAAVFDDFFIRDIKNNHQWKSYAYDNETEELLSWIKDYMIGQCRYFGGETLRRIVNEYSVVGLLQVLYPNYNEIFGSIRNRLIPLVAYKAVKEYAETTTFNDQTLEMIMTEDQPLEAMDKLQNILWSTINSKNYSQSSHEVIPTTVGFYRSEVTLLLQGGSLTNSCVSVSRFVALLGRSLGIPVGIINPSGTVGHWGNFVLVNNTIISDRQSQELYYEDKLSSKKKFIIRWPSLFSYSREGFGLNKEYFERADVKIPENISEMEIREFIKIINLEIGNTLQ